MPRTRVEERLLASISDQLLSAEAIERFKKDVRELLQARRKESATERKVRLTRVKRLRAEVENLTDAIAGGALRTSAALAARLSKAEAELTDAEHEMVADDAAVAKVIDLVPKAAERYRRMVAGLSGSLSGSISEARREIGQLLGGSVRLMPNMTTGKLVAHVGLNEYALAARCLGTRAYISNGSGGRI